MSGYFLFFSSRQHDYSKLLLAARHRAILTEWTEMSSLERLQWIKDAKQPASLNLISDLNLKEEKKLKLDVTNNPFFATVLADKAETLSAKYRPAPPPESQHVYERGNKKRLLTAEEIGVEEEGNSSAGELIDSSGDEDSHVIINSNDDNTASNGHTSDGRTASDRSTSRRWRKKRKK